MSNYSVLPIVNTSVDLASSPEKATYREKSPIIRGVLEEIKITPHK